MSLCGLLIEDLFLGNLDGDELPILRYKGAGISL